MKGISFSLIACSLEMINSKFEVKVEVVGVGTKRGRLAYVVRPVTYVLRSNTSHY